MDPDDVYAAMSACGMVGKGRQLGKSAALAMAYGGAHTGRISGDLMRMRSNPMETNETRFRSFCERYVLARASMFREGHEEEDQWTCMLNAKSAYRKIEAMGRGITNEDVAMAAKEAQQAGQVTSPGVGFPMPNGWSGQMTPAMRQAFDRLTRGGEKRLIGSSVDSKGWTGYAELAKIHDETIYRHGKKRRPLSR